MSSSTEGLCRLYAELILEHKAVK